MSRQPSVVAWLQRFALNPRRRNPGNTPGLQLRAPAFLCLLVRGGGTGYLQLSRRDRTRDPLCGAPPSMSSLQEGCPELSDPPGEAAFALCSHLLTWARLDTRSASLPEKLRGMVLGLGPGSRQPLSASSCSFLDPGATHPLPAQALGHAGGELPSWEHTLGTRASSGGAGLGHLLFCPHYRSTDRASGEGTWRQRTAGCRPGLLPQIPHLKTPLFRQPSRCP